MVLIFFPRSCLLHPYHHKPPPPPPTSTLNMDPRPAPSCLLARTHIVPSMATMPRRNTAPSLAADTTCPTKGPTRPAARLSFPRSRISLNR